MYLNNKQYIIDRSSYRKKIKLSKIRDIDKISHSHFLSFTGRNYSYDIEFYYLCIYLCLYKFGF